MSSWHLKVTAQFQVQAHVWLLVQSCGPGRATSSSKGQFLLDGTLPGGTGSEADRQGHVPGLWEVSQSGCSLVLQSPLQPVSRGLALLLALHLGSLRLAESPPQLCPASPAGRGVWTRGSCMSMCIALSFMFLSLLLNLSHISPFPPIEVNQPIPPPAPGPHPLLRVSVGHA